MKENLIITIGRQFGSGGREIGKLLADKFGIAYYDKELINEASKVSGLSTEYFEKADERAPNGLMHAFSINWITSAGGILNDGGLSNEYIFKFQSDVILKIAEERPCVIVGRCACAESANTMTLPNAFWISFADLRSEERRVGKECRL